MKYVTIFQNYGLLPWRSVQKKCKAWTGNKETWQKKEKKKITDHCLEMVGLRSSKETSGTAFRRYAAEGGNRQSTGGRAGNLVYG